MRVLYFYLMRNAPDRVRTAVPDHAEYWGTLGVHAYLGGPFADRSGGLITFEVASIDEAKRLVAEVRGSSSRPSAVEACGDPLGGTVFTYREDMRRAWDRIRSFPSRGSKRASGPSSTPITVRGFPFSSLMESSDATSTAPKRCGRTSLARASG